MLNSTLIATERAMCCVLENYQTKGGIRVPEVLQEYMGGVSFIPFVTTMPKPKKGPAPPQYVPTKEQIAELDEGRTELQAYMDKIAPAISKALNQPLRSGQTTRCRPSRTSWARRPAAAAAPPRARAAHRAATSI